MPKVAIVKGTKPLDVTVEALEMIDATDALPAEKTVLKAQLH